MSVGPRDPPPDLRTGASTVTFRPDRRVYFPGGERVHELPSRPQHLQDRLDPGRAHPCALRGRRGGSSGAQEPVKGSGDAPVRKGAPRHSAETSSKSRAAGADIRAYEQGIEDVRKSGVLDKALKVGDRAPEFALPDATGKTIRLSELIARGPVVVTWSTAGAGALTATCAARASTRACSGNPHRAARALVAISPETPDNSLSTAEEESPRTSSTCSATGGTRPRTAYWGGLQDPRGHRRPDEGPPGQAERRRLGRASPLEARLTSSTATGSSATRSSTRTTARGPSPPT